MRTRLGIDTNLTDKEEKFLKAYLEFEWTNVKCAEYAGYAGNYNQLSKLADQVLKRPRVREVILKAAGNVMPASEVLSRLTTQARSVYADYIDEDGRVDLVRLKRDGRMHLIKAIRPGKYGNTIEFMDSQKALELLGKYYALWTDRVEEAREVTLKVVYEDPPQLVDTIDGELTE
jgi:hypothetical protein